MVSTNTRNKMLLALKNTIKLVDGKLEYIGAKYLNTEQIKESCKLSNVNQSKIKKENPDFFKMAVRIKPNNPLDVDRYYGLSVKGFEEIKPLLEKEFLKKIKSEKNDLLRMVNNFSNKMGKNDEYTLKKYDFDEFGTIITFMDYLSKYEIKLPFKIKIEKV